MTDAVIVSGTRTAIGNYGRALQGIPAVKLGSITIREALTASFINSPHTSKPLDTVFTSLPRPRQSPIREEHRNPATAQRKASSAP